MCPDCEGGSPRGSPASGCSSGAAMPIREEEEACSRAAELLFSSPSLPNISLGRAHVAAAAPPAAHAPQHEERAPPFALARDLSWSHSPHNSVSLPPVSEAEACCAGPAGLAPAGIAPAGLAPAAHSPAVARLGKRLLGRTYSAPLPLGDPALQPPVAHHYLCKQIRKTVSLALRCVTHDELYDFITVLNIEM